MFLQRRAAADVVLPERVAAIDDDVAGLHQLCQCLDGGLGDLAGRQHHPGGARLLQFRHEIFQRVGAGCAFAGEAGDRLRILVVDHGGVAVLHQPADDIAAHPAEPDHAELHILTSLAERFRNRGIERGQSRSEVALEMDAQRAPPAFGEHVEIAARLRRLDDAETRLLAGHRQILASSAVICRNTPLSGPPL